MQDLEQFKLYLIQEQHGKKRKRSLRTVEIHLGSLRRLVKHVPDLDPQKILAYLLTLFEQGRKGTYLNDYIDMLHVYGRFKQTDAYATLKYFPEDKFEKATMSDQEIEAFLQLPPPVTTRRDTRSGKELTYTFDTHQWQVKTLFWKCLAYSGARPGEIAHLTTQTVDFGKQVFILTGKTGTRFVPIAPLLISELQAYIKTLQTEYLFPSPRGGKTRQGGVINDTTWGYDFHNRLKRLGIKRKNLTPYSLRHSFITRMLDEGINLYPLQNIVGHVQGSPVTATYYHHTTKTLVKTLAKDPLTRSGLPFDERFKSFRTFVRDALQTFTTNYDEEKLMLKMLIDNT